MLISFIDDDTSDSKAIVFTMLDTCRWILVPDLVIDKQIFQ